MASVTNNFSFSLQSAGDNAGVWGTTGSGGEGGLNLSIFTPLDSILGSMLPVSMAAGSNFLSNVQFQNAGFILTGTGGSTLVTPLSANASGSPSGPCAGGKFIVANNTNGLVTVITAYSGSTGVVVPQGFAASLYADINTGNVFYAHNGLPGYAAAFAGNPNTAGAGLAGTAGTATTNASLAFDYVNGVLYICTTTGSATGTPSPQAVWTSALGASIPLATPQGYLTPTSGTAIITGDATAQTAIYYTPYVGGNAAIYNGTTLVSYPFSQLQLNLTGLAGSGIYDVYLAYTTLTSAGTAVIGTGPIWGTVTPGSGARGAGAAIQRDSRTGLWVNGTTMTFAWNNGSISGTVSAAAGTLVYLGSLYIDSGGGTVTCNRSYGQSRKWGVWNAYNRQPLILQGGDPSSFWNYGGNGVWRQSNGSSSNFLSAFTGLAEEEVEAEFRQNVNQSTSTVFASVVGIGLNSTTAPSGFVGTTLNNTGNSNNLLVDTASFIQTPFLGVNVFNMLEVGNVGSPTPTSKYFGTISQMLMTLRYNG